MIQFNKYQKNQYINSLDRSHFEELEDVKDTEENRKTFLERNKRTFFKIRNGILGEMKELSPLNEGYTTLAWALSPLSYENKSSLENKEVWPRWMIGVGFIVHETLQDEFNQAISNSDFPWTEFLRVNKIIKPDDKMTDERAKKLIQSWISEILDELPDILQEVEFILPTPI